MRVRYPIITHDSLFDDGHSVAELPVPVESASDGMNAEAVGFPKADDLVKFCTNNGSPLGLYGLGIKRLTARLASLHACRNVARVGRCKLGRGLFAVQFGRDVLEEAPRGTVKGVTPISVLDWKLGNPPCRRCKSDRVIRCCGVELGTALKASLYKQWPE